MPFLLELLSGPQVQEKDEILKLLAALANGASYLEANLDYTKDPDRKGTPELLAQMDQELRWVWQAARAVERGTPVYVAQLSADDPKARMAAAYVLSNFRVQAPLTAPVIAAALVRERDARAKASDYLSLPALLEPEQIGLFARGVASEQDELPRLAAAMAYLRLARSQTPTEVAQILADVVAVASETTASQYEELPFAESTLQADICGTLGELGEQGGAFAIPVLIEALTKMPVSSSTEKRSHPGENVISISFTPAPGEDGATPPPSFSGMVTNDPRTVPALMITITLLSLTFGDPASYEVVTPQTLTEQQRAVLRAIVESEAAWVFSVNTHEILESYKLPREREDLRTLATA